MEKVKGKLHPSIWAAWNAGGPLWSMAHQVMSQIEDAIDFGFVEGLRSQVHAEVEDKLRGHR